MPADRGRRYRFRFPAAPCKDVIDIAVTFLRVPQEMQSGALRNSQWERGCRGGTEEEAPPSLGSGGQKAIGLQELSVSMLSSFLCVCRNTRVCFLVHGHPCVSSPGCTRVKHSQTQSSAVVIFLLFAFFGKISKTTPCNVHRVPVVVSLKETVRWS